MEAADTRGQTAAAAHAADAMICLAWVGLMLADPHLPPPIRPEGFWGAIGVPFPQAQGKVRLSLRAEPTRLAVGEPLTLTLTVRGTINPTALERPDLRSLEAFRSRFAIDDLPDPPQSESDRVFAWRLRPRSTEVSSIPPLEYVYWRSGAQPPSRGFQTTDTGPAIPLSVRPEGEPVEPPPESFPTLPERSPWRIWADFAALAAGLLPFVILELWSRRRRLSRPARRALACAEPMAALRRYLSERFDVPARAWVPSEVIPGLTAVGVPLALAERAAQLIEQAEIARFGDGPAPDAATARTLIVELEAWLWQRSSP